MMLEMDMEHLDSLIKKLNSINIDSKFPVSNDDYSLLVEHGINPERLTNLSKGWSGHIFAGKYQIGVYICSIGYYKIIDIKYNFRVPDGRVYDKMLITNYDLNCCNDFYDEDVIVNPSPLFNRCSIGPKVELKVGMILHIKEQTTLVGNSYKIVWEIV